MNDSYIIIDKMIKMLEEDLGFSQPDNTAESDPTVTELNSPAASPAMPFEQAEEIQITPFEQSEKVENFTNDIEFDIRFRGYDRGQVDHYLDKLTEDYNAICKKCASLEDENDGLRQTLASISRKGVMTL